MSEPAPHRVHAAHPLPASLVEHARDFADGRREPAEPRNASTVVLLRDGVPEPGGLDVYLLRRHAGMEFAAGMCVFPGGGVDPRDFASDVAWVGPSPQEWARLLGTDAALARALVCAAVRETFEESGVLFAGAGPDDVVADTTGEDWETDRARLESRDLSLSDFLDARGLCLRTDLLGVLAAWLTPEFEPKRYRTWFFVAALPTGQRTRDVSGESDRVTWLPVADAIRSVDAGDMLMLPPTYATCLAMYDHLGTAEVLAAAATEPVRVIEPRAVFDGDDAFLDLPEWIADLADDVARRMRP